SAGVAIGLADTGANTIVNFGTIIGTSGTAVRFGAGSDDLVIEPGSKLTGAVGNFHVGAVLDFAGVGTATGVVYSGGTLSVMNGGSVIGSVTLAGNFTQSQFTVAADGGGGTNVGLVANKLLYMTGTIDPWSGSPNFITPSDPGSPDSAMNTAFGAGNWTKVN